MIDTVFNDRFELDRLCVNEAGGGRMIRFVGNESPDAS